jgi:hypothetical protein
MSSNKSFDSVLLELYHHKGYSCILYNIDDHSDHRTYYDFYRAIEDSIYYGDQGINYKLINTEEYKKRSE